MGKFVDLTGKNFGRLKVLKRTEDKIQPNGRKLLCGYVNANVLKKL